MLELGISSILTIKISFVAKIQSKYLFKDKYKFEMQNPVLGDLFQEVDKTTMEDKILRFYRWKQGAIVNRNND